MQHGTRLPSASETHTLTCIVSRENIGLFQTFLCGEQLVPECCRRGRMGPCSEGDFPVPTGRCTLSFAILQCLCSFFFFCFGDTPLGAQSFHPAVSGVAPGGLGETTCGTCSDLSGANPAPPAGVTPEQPGRRSP